MSDEDFEKLCTLLTVVMKNQFSVEPVRTGDSLIVRVTDENKSWKLYTGRKAEGSWYVLRKFDNFIQVADLKTNRLEYMDAENISADKIFTYFLKLNKETVSFSPLWALTFLTESS